MRKKGQIAIFMIIGILAIFSFILLYIVQQPRVEVIHTAEHNPTQATVFERSVEQCLHSVGKEALFIIGLYGDEHLSILPVSDASSKKPFFQDDKPMPLSSLPEIEDFVSVYIYKHLGACLQELVQNGTIPEISRKFLLANTSVNVTITDDRTNVLLSLYPKDNENVTQFKAIIPVRFGLLYSLIIKINGEILQQGSTILSCKNLPFGVTGTLGQTSKQTLIQLYDDLSERRDDFIFVIRFVVLGNRFISSDSSCKY